MSTRTEKAARRHAGSGRRAIRRATQRAVMNSPISGLQPYPAFIWSMALIKRAAAEVNIDLGLLDRKLGEPIVRAAQEVLSRAVE